MGKIAYESYINSVSEESVNLGYGGNYCPDADTILRNWKNISLTGAIYADNQLVEVDTITKHDLYQFVIAADGSKSTTVYANYIEYPLEVNIRSTKNGLAQGWRIASVANTWCTATKRDDTVVITCNDNTSTAGRLTNIVLAQEESGEFITINVQQSGKDPEPDSYSFYFTENSSSAYYTINVPSTAGDRYVDVTSTKNGARLGWSITSGAPAFGTAKNEDGDVAVTWLAHTGTDTRTFTVTLKQDETGSTITLTVVQSGSVPIPDEFLFYYTVDKTTSKSVTEPGNGNTLTYDITSTKNGTDLNWTVSSNQSWLKPTKVGNSIQLVWDKWAVTTNHVGVLARTAVVTMKQDTTNKTITFTVKQDGIYVLSAVDVQGLPGGGSIDGDSVYALYLTQVFSYHNVNSASDFGHIEFTVLEKPSWVEGVSITWPTDSNPGGTTGHRVGFAILPNPSLTESRSGTFVLYQPASGLTTSFVATQEPANVSLYFIEGPEDLCEKTIPASNSSIMSERFFPNVNSATTLYPTYLIIQDQTVIHTCRIVNGSPYDYLNVSVMPSSGITRTAEVRVFFKQWPEKYITFKVTQLPS